MNNLRTEYLRIYPKSPDMLEYSMKQVSSYVTLGDGSFFVFNKPSIEKCFCFSTGYNLQTDPNMEKSAREMRDKAHTDESYFIEENMETFAHLDNLIAEGKQLYAFNQYITPSKIVCINEAFRMKDSEIAEAYELTPDDIELIKQAIIEEKAKFLKRLKTYLKRYGLTKVRAWTYLSD